MSNEIKVIKVKNGFYVNGWRSNKYYYNGKRPEETFNNDWYFLNFKFENLKKVEMLLPAEYINYRFEIKDKALVNDKIPKVIEAVKDENYGWVLKDHKDLYSLYTLIKDELPEKFEEIEVNFNVVLEYDNISQPPDINFKINNNSWLSDYKYFTLTKRDFKPDLISTILFPDIIHHELPVTATSKQVYDILRFYIKEHINNQYARITSDYDFCFTVVKVIKMTDAEKAYKTIYKNKGKKRIEVKQDCYITNREVKIFEMTYSPKNYEGYTPVKEIHGNNLEDLKNKIIAFCEEVINKINKPLVDCPHCKGLGVIEA